MHAAILARAFLSPYVRRGQSIDLDQFMIRDRSRDAGNRVTAFIRYLFRVSKPAPPEAKK